MVSSKQYIDFLDNNKLEYEEVQLDLLKDNSTSLIVKVDEKLFNPDKLKILLHNRIKRYGVNLNLGTKIERDDLDNYDFVINATYSNLNANLDPSQRLDYQFELCEKPVVRLPREYKNKSRADTEGT